MGLGAGCGLSFGGASGWCCILGRPTHRKFPAGWLKKPRKVGEGPGVLFHCGGPRKLGVHLLCLLSIGASCFSKFHQVCRKIYGFGAGCGWSFGGAPRWGWILGRPTYRKLPADWLKSRVGGGHSQIILRNAKKSNIVEKRKSVNKVLAQMPPAKKIKQCLWCVMYMHTCIHKEKISLESQWYVDVTSLWLSSREASYRSIVRWRSRGRSCFTILRIGGWRLKG